MPQRRARVAGSAAQTELAAALAAARAELDAPAEFPPEALAEAEAAQAPEPERDLRDLPFATLDPAGSRDLDQAFHLARRGDGYTVHYAIADVPGFVRAGGAIDAEARRRGQTLYAADGTVPLHPRTLSEDRASLLPRVDRPALVWTFELDATATVRQTRLERALIRSRAQLDYATTQEAIDGGRPGAAELLPEIGALRLAQERERGGASLNLPDEEIVQTADGGYDIERRRPLPVEEWNAQLSLMTGIAAAALMLDAGVGILRTMPEPDAEAFATFRLQTRVLGRPWVSGTYGEYLAALDRSDPLTLPVLQTAAALFRGAGYVAFDGTPPDQTRQAAIGAPYAHVTAPLRRLVDRWGLSICLEVAAGRPAPEWARSSLHDLPALMQASGQRASRLGSMTLNIVEAALLSSAVGTTLPATVIEVRGERAIVQLADPPVTATAPLPAGARPGDVVSVTVESTDIATGEVVLAV